MGKKVVHFRKDCIGCGNCVEFAPDFWELSEEDGKANLKESIEKRGVYLRNLNVIDEEKNKQAADSCPVNIIKIC